MTLTQIVAALWAIEKILEIVSRLTPWKWDDNLGVIIANIITALKGKK